MFRRVWVAGLLGLSLLSAMILLAAPPTALADGPGIPPTFYVNGPPHAGPSGPIGQPGMSAVARMPLQTFNQAAVPMPHAAVPMPQAAVPMPHAASPAMDIAATAPPAVQSFSQPAQPVTLRSNAGSNDPPAVMQSNSDSSGGSVTTRTDPAFDGRRCSDDCHVVDCDWRCFARQKQVIVRPRPVFLPQPVYLNVAPVLQSAYVPAPASYAAPAPVVTVSVTLRRQVAVAAPAPTTTVMQRMPQAPMPPAPPMPMAPPAPQRPPAMTPMSPFTPQPVAPRPPVPQVAPPAPAVGPPAVSPARVQGPVTVQGPKGVVVQRPIHRSRGYGRPAHARPGRAYRGRRYAPPQRVYGRPAPVAARPVAARPVSLARYGQGGYGPSFAPRLPNAGTGGLLDQSQPRTGVSPWLLLPVAAVLLGGLWSYRRLRHS